MDSKTFLINSLFLIYTVLSALTDLWYRKIYNSLTFPAIILGITFNLIHFGLNGLALSVIGLLAGFGISIIFYLAGGIGAGDVKFLAAVGSIMGTKFMLIGAFYGVILAGIYALWVLIKRQRLFSTLKEILTAVFLFITLRKPEHVKFGDENSIYAPYAAFLAIGMLIKWAVG